MRKNAQIVCFEGKLTVKLEVGTHTGIPTLETELTES
jgi:hypothetical protein